MHLMETHIDMMGREVNLHKRSNLNVVSLVPSQTELLYELGLAKQVIGQTRFCIHPEEEYKSEKFIGGTKQLNIAKILKLNPDLIIANKEENDKNQIEELEKLFPVWISDIANLNDNQKMITSLGEIFKVSGQASWINQQINMSFSLLGARLKEPKTCLYLIWRKPYMTVGSDTFIDSILTRGGFVNVIKEKRYPELTAVEMHALNPEIIFMSSEPYPFKENHIEELRVYFPESEIKLVNGELFSWYGSRLIQTPSYLLELNKALQANA